MPNNGTAITANPDMVQEVRVQTSNYAAGARLQRCTDKRHHEEMEAATFHGSLYDYIRNHNVSSQ